MMALRVMTVSIYRLYFLLLFTATLLTPALAQMMTTIIPDDSLGTTVSQSGSVHTIDGGTILGPNQFHSFDRFDVGSGNTANFTGPTNVENILSRVTGGAASMIDGTLQSDIVGANLFLLNPKGVIFGSNARLETRGAFHVSTADSLRLEDAGVFYTSLSASSELTIASPVAFGFVQANPAGITLAGGRLQAPEGETLSIIGGEIKINGRGAGLVAASGRVAVASVLSPGTVRIASQAQPDQLDATGIDQLGEVRLEQGALISASGNRGGTVVIRAGSLVVDNAMLKAHTTGNLDGKSTGLDIQVSGEVVLNNRASLTSETLRAGSAGAIRVTAGSLRMDGAARIESSTSAEGRAGDIRVETQTSTLTGRAQIISDTSSSGQGGTISMTVTEEVTMTGQSTTVSVLPGKDVALRTSTTGVGHAGDIVMAAGTITLTNGAQISSLTIGPGRAGTVTVRAREIVNMEGTSANGFLPSAITANSQGIRPGAGDAGAVLVEANRVNLRGGAQINSLTIGPGRAGTVTVLARETVNLVGERSAITASSQSQRVEAGAAGTVRVEANHVTVREGAQIISLTFGPGQGGSVVVRANETVSLEDIGANGTPNGIFASAEGMREGSGDAGTVLVEADKVAVSGGAQITSGTSGPGQGGMVTIQARETVTLIGTGSAISANSGSRDSAGTGAAGRVLVEANLIALRDGAQIISLTFGPGQGGTVTVRAQETVILVGTAPSGSPSSAILASTEGRSAGAGEGGMVVVEATNVILREGAQIGSGTFGPGDGGNVTVRVSDTLTITGSNPENGISSGLFATAQGTEPGSGAAGEVLIETPVLLLTEGGLINSETFGPGDGGNVTVRVSDTLTITGSNPENGLPSGLSVNTSGSGKGGKITVHAQQLQLTEGAQIQGTGTGTGNAGDITISVQDTLMVENSSMRTNTTQSDGGDVNIAANFMRLRDGQITTAVGNGDGGGGNIIVDTNLGLLERSEIRANAFGGPGGNITIQADGFITDASSVISASSAQSVDGTVSIQGLADLSGTLTPIDPSFAAAAALQSDPCIGRLRGEGISRFTRAGRDRLPTEPGGLLPSPSGMAAAMAPPARQAAARLSQGQPRLASRLRALAQRR